MHLSCPTIRATCPVHLSLLEFRVQRSTEHKAPRYVVLSTPPYLVSSRSKYPPQHPILETPQVTFLPQCERPSCTPIQNNRQGYSSVYLNLYTFGQQTGSLNILHGMGRRRCYIKYK